MSAKHRDPEYQRNARIVRQQVAAARRAGREVTCWRCGRPIDPEQRYDVGHLDPHGGPSRSNLAAEHRYKTAWCIGNRADGGRLAHAQRPKPRTTSTVTKTGVLPW